MASRADELKTFDMDVETGAWGSGGWIKRDYSEWPKEHHDPGDYCEAEPAIAIIHDSATSVGSLPDLALAPGASRHPVPFLKSRPFTSGA